MFLVWKFFNNAFVYEALICGGLKGRIEEHEPLAQVENKSPAFSIIWDFSMTGLGNFVYTGS